MSATCDGPQTRPENGPWVGYLVGDGAWFAVMPEHSVVSAAAQCRPLVEPDLVRKVCMVRAAHRDLSPIARVFWDTFERSRAK